MQGTVITYSIVSPSSEEIVMQYHMGALQMKEDAVNKCPPFLHDSVPMEKMWYGAIVVPL